MAPTTTYGHAGPGGCVVANVLTHFTRSHIHPGCNYTFGYSALTLVLLPTSCAQLTLVGSRAWGAPRGTLRNPTI